MIYKSFKSLLIIAFISNNVIQSKIIIGANVELQPLYQDEKFTCFDNSNTFPSSYINDDYCDCKDGSDEPGTSACDNGQFVCQNNGDLPKTIRSSFVNDGICDCCDGTDEHSSGTSCTDTCKELGAERMKAQNEAKVKFDAGHLIYEQYRDAAKDKLAILKTELDSLNAQKSSMEEEKNKLQEHKNMVEEPEKKAKDEHHAAWQADLASKRAEDDLENAHLMFQRLDLNKDGLLTLDEIRTRTELDVDASGDVTAEEAKVYMVESEQMIFSEFHEKSYPSLKTVIQEPSESTEAPPLDPAAAAPSSPEDTPVHPTTTPMPESQDPSTHKHTKTVTKHRYTERGEETYEEEEEEEEGDDQHADDQEINDDLADDTMDPSHGDEKQETPNQDEPQEDADAMPAYSKATQALIDAADSARSSYDDIEKKVSDNNEKIRELEGKLNENYGPDNVYYELRGQCFDLIDHEYKYTWCPFDKAEQSQASGGSTTSLGTWGKWNGPPEDLYSSMLFSNGLKCWNGPERSARVNIVCSSETSVFKVTEPNKCEYEFYVSTPAACNNFKPEQKDAGHDEL